MPRPKKVIVKHKGKQRVMIICNPTTKFEFLRHRLGLAQRELAKILGVSCALISRIETGDLDVSSKIERLMYVLKVAGLRRVRAALQAEGARKPAFMRIVDQLAKR